MVDLSRVTAGLDHVALATSDLEEARGVLVDLGLSCTAVGEVQWPGDEGEHRARCVSVMVDDGYLDIIEFAEAPDILMPTGVVLRTRGFAEARAWLLAAGVRCGKPYTIVRRFHGDGSEQRYEIFGIEPRHRNGLPQSLIETAPADPMHNLEEHRADVTSLVDAASLVGVDLSTS